MKTLWRAFIIFLVLLIPFAQVPEAKAYTGCNIQISNPGSDGYYSSSTDAAIAESIIVRSSDVVYNDAPASADGSNRYYVVLDAVFYVGANPNPQSVSGDLNIRQLSNGTMAVDLTSTVANLMDSSQGDIRPVNFVFKLVKDTGLTNHAVVCSINFVAQKAVPYSCGSVGVNLTRRGTETVNTAFTVAAGNLAAGRSYAIYFNRTDGTGAIIKVPLSNQGSTLTNGYSWNAGPGRYVLAVSDNPNEIVTNGTPISSLVPADHDAGSCMAYFDIPNPISSLPEDATPGDNFPQPGEGITDPSFSLCRQADPADRAKCVACYGSGAPDDNVADGAASDTEAPRALWTAFGCVQTSPTGMIQSFLRIILGLAGGIVLLVILYGAFLLTTSSGDPKRVQEGQEMVTSAVMGILFIIFSVIILQFIGVKLLQIPGFGT